MTAEELIRHPSMQREFSRFRKCCGKVVVERNKIILDGAEIIPLPIVKTFAARIKRLDKAKLIEVQIQNGA